MFGIKHVLILAEAFKASRPNCLILKEGNNFYIALAAWRGAVDATAHALQADAGPDKFDAEAFRHCCNW